MKLTVYISKNFYIDEVKILKYVLEHYVSIEDRYEKISFVHNYLNNVINITFELSSENFNQEDFIKFILEKCKVHYEYKLNNNLLTLDDKINLINIFKKLDSNYKFNFDESKFNELTERKNKIKEEQHNSILSVLHTYSKKNDELQKAKEIEINEVSKKYGVVLENIDKQISDLLNI